MARRRALLSFVLFAAVAAPARADVPPEPDDCSLEKQCKDGATCPTLGGEIDAACAAEKTKAGMTLKCQQKKAGVAKAVYCKEAKKGCLKSSVASAPGDAGGLVAFAALGVALLQRRSRRRV
jgi:hypothetical protein